MRAGFRIRQKDRLRRDRGPTMAGHAGSWRQGSPRRDSMELHTQLGDGDGVGRTEIAAADRIIRPYIRRTPVITVDGVDFGSAAGRLSFKLEFLQHAGSFKT